MRRDASEAMTEISRPRGFVVATDPDQVAAGLQDQWTDGQLRRINVGRAGPAVIENVSHDYGVLGERYVRKLRRRTAPVVVPVPSLSHVLRRLKEEAAVLVAATGNTDWDDPEV